MKSLITFWRENSAKTVQERQQMPCIRIKEAYQNTKHVIDGIELSCRVEELKQKTAEKTNIPAEQQSMTMHVSSCLSSVLTFCSIRIFIVIYFLVYFI